MLMDANRGEALSLGRATSEAAFAIRPLWWRRAFRANSLKSCHG